VFSRRPQAFYLKSVNTVSDRGMLMLHIYHTLELEANFSKFLTKAVSCYLYGVLLADSNISCLPLLLTTYILPVDAVE